MLAGSQHLDGTAAGLSRAREAAGRAASPNASWLKEQIGDCTADGVARVGEQVGLQNGAVSSALSDLVAEINESEDRWDSEAFGTLPAQNSKSAITTSNYGNVLEGPIIVFDGGPEYSTTGGAFNGDELIVGFAWAVIYDVRTSGGAKDKNIWVKLKPMADQELGFEGGGLVDAGVLYQPDPVRVYQVERPAGGGPAAARTASSRRATSRTYEEVDTRP